MDILILDSWLREYLITNANATDIARCLSLCGPSVEKTEKLMVNGKSDFLYHIEVTTNRVDMMSVYGIAREASVILPEFGYTAKLSKIDLDEGKYTSGNAAPIKFVSNPQLVYRMIGVVLEIGKINGSQEFIKERLNKSNIRALNNIVDITNYVMTEIGHPTHVFDYDLVKPKLIVRESKKGERVTSFDGKEYSLPGGDIVFENEKHEIIDLPGIIGTKNSVVNENTKRILFFIDTNNPVNIRKTSMTLGIRTVAATLNEKGVDPNLAELALKRGLFLYKKYAGAKQVSPVYDSFPTSQKIERVYLTHSKLEKILGIKISSDRVLSILKKLQVRTVFNKKNGTYTSIPPSFRAKDILISEDIIEEIARIYGYHNLPSTLMAGRMPENINNNVFKFENTLKRILSGLGGSEVYTLSLVGKENIHSDKSLKLRNPLGTDTEYLRTTLMPSLVEAVLTNNNMQDRFHIFEIANVYLPRINKLPDENLTLAGIFSNYDFRTAKGIVESLLENLHFNYQFEIHDAQSFLANQHLSIKSENSQIGHFGVLEKEGLIYYEFSVDLLRSLYNQFNKFSDIPKFPPQIEDLTLVLPERTSTGEVYKHIKTFNKFISDVELKDIYKDSYTFRIWYVSSEKTLENTEVEKLRSLLIASLTKKFSASVK